MRTTLSISVPITSIGAMIERETSMAGRQSSRRTSGRHDSPTRKAKATPADVAGYLRVDEKTLSQWRWQGKGPRYAKLGEGRTAPIRYDWEDVHSWLEAQTGGGGAAA